MSSFTRHPLQTPEILRLILSCRHILGPSDLLSTSLVNRTWSEITKSVCWNEIELDTESWVDPYHQSLVAQLRVHGQLVRILVLKECGADRARFNTVLSTMTNLQAIVIDRVMLHNNPTFPLRALDAMLPSISQLRYLSLPHISSSSNGVETLLDICQSANSRVRHLDLIDSELDDKALRVIAESCVSLRSLDLSRNELVTFQNFFSGGPSQYLCTGSPSSILGSQFLTLSSKTARVSSLSTTVPENLTGSEHNSSFPVDSFCFGSTSQPSTTIGPYPHLAGLKHDPTHTNTNVNNNKPASTSSFALAHQQQQKLEWKRQQTELNRQRMIKRTRKSSRLFEEDTPFMHLEELNLTFCVGITNPDLKSLFRSLCPRSLTSLNLQFTNIQDSGLESLAASYDSTYNSLTTIKLSYCSQITARGIRALVQNCPELLELEFLSCDLVSADCFLGPMPWVCKKLKRLEFTFHPTVLFSLSNRAHAADGEEQEQEEEEEEEDNSVVIIVQQSLDPTQGQGEEATSQQQAQTPGPSTMSGNKVKKSKQISIVGPHIQYNNTNNINNKNLKGVHVRHQEYDGINNRTKNNDSGKIKAGYVHDQAQESHASVQREYHAMFRQLKRLSQLRSLHIYNSPLLNGGGPGEDGYYGEGEAATEDSTATAAVDTTEDVAPSNTPTTIEVEVEEEQEQEEEEEQEDEQDQDPGSGSGYGSNSEQAYAIQHRADPAIVPSPSADCRERRSRSRVPTGMSGVGMFGDISLATTFHNASRDGSGANTPKINLDEVPMHPFSLRVGLKALGRLKELEALTLYERQSMVIGAEEVRWISKAFPQLVALQLRGAIDISDESLHRLHTRHPSMKVRVCSLFESVCVS